MEKPTPEQAAWVISQVADMINEGGTFRYLVYNKLGYDTSEYGRFMSAGGMTVTNFICEAGLAIKILKKQSGVDGEEFFDWLLDTIVEEKLE